MKNTIIAILILASNPSLAMTQEQGEALGELVGHFYQQKPKPDSGLLDFNADPDRNGAMVIESEWESIDKLMDFAHNDEIHRKLMRIFKKSDGFVFKIDHDVLANLPKNRRVKAINLFDQKTKTFTLTVTSSDARHERIIIQARL